MATAVYVLNLIPSKGQPKVTPLELFTKEKSNLTYLRSIGCVCWAKVPDIFWKKWDPKGKKCIFIGYTNTSNNFHVFGPVIKKVFVITNIKFIENNYDANEIIDKLIAEDTNDLKKLCDDDKLN